MINKGTIISGFPGVGKTTAAQKYKNVKDLESSYYLFETPQNLSLDEYEKLKGNTNRTPKLNGMRDYIKDILKYQKEYDYVFIAMFPELLQLLADKGVDVQLVLPNRQDKENYKNKYLNRGNSEKWANSIISNWDMFLDVSENNALFKNKPIILDNNQTLSDIILGEV